MGTAVFLLNTSAVLCILFGLYIITRDHKSSLYRVFMLLCVIIAILAFISGQIFMTTSKQEMFFWDRLYAFFAFICWAVNLNFYLLLTGKPPSVRLTTAIYIPAVILIILEFTSCPLVSDFVRQGDRWKYIYTGTYYFYMLYSVSYAIADMVLLYRWSRSSCYNKHRLQAKVILISTIILWSICVTTDYVLSLFEFYAFPPLGATGRIIYALIIWYSFIRYRFLNTGLTAMLDELVQNSGDNLVLLHSDFTIKRCSPGFREFLRPGRKNIYGRNIFDVAAESADKKLDTEHIKTGASLQFTERLHFQTAGGKITAVCSFRCITDKFGDVEVILMKCDEEMDEKRFSEVFNLSERQMEIISLALEGLSNTEISQKLNISKKTTETHFFNIYNKLGINNRIELYNMGIEYNLMLKNPVPVESR